VHNHNIGLGNETGSLHFTAALGGFNHVVPEGGDVDNAVELAVKRLDDVLDGEVPTLIKMDVEGFEQQVCEGAEQSLRHPECLAMIVEIVENPNYSGARYGNSKEKLRETIAEYGFEPCLYRPFERELVRETDGSTKEKHSRRNTIFVKDFDKAAARLKDAPKFTVRGTSL